METLESGMPSRTGRAEERRRHLLDTARKLFVENGFHQTGMAQVAAASGIKVGQIYRDFASKEEIIAAICEADVSDWLREDLLSTAVAANDLAAVRQWIDRFGAPSESPGDSPMLAEIVAEAWRNERVAQINRRIDERVRNSLASALTALAPSPDRAPGREVLVEAILTMGFGIEMRRIIRPDLDLAALGQIISAMINRHLEDGASLSD